MSQVGPIWLDELDAKGLPRGGGLLSELGSAALAGLPPGLSSRGLTGHSGLARKTVRCRLRHRWPCHPLGGCLLRAGWKLACCGSPGVQSHGRDDQHSRLGRRRPVFRGRWFAAGRSDSSFEGRLAAAQPHPPGDSLDNPALHLGAPFRAPPAGRSRRSSITLAVLAFALQVSSRMNVIL